MAISKKGKVQEESAQQQIKQQKKVVVKKQDEELAVNPVVDRLVWLVSLVLICGAIFGNYYYTNFVVIDESTMGRMLRVMAVIAVIAVAIVVLVFTNKGHSFIDFARKSYIELKKVVWPTRQEAMQTTLIIFIAVCLVSLFLYLCDVVFLSIIRAITL